MTEEKNVRGYFRNGIWINTSNQDIAHTLEIIPNEGELPFVFTKGENQYNPIILLDGKKLKCVKAVQISLESGKWIEARLTLVCHVKGTIPFIEDSGIHQSE